MCFSTNDERGDINENEKRENKMIYFLHIPKTGGTSMQQVIINNIGDKYYRISEYKHPFGDWLHKDRSYINVIGGHFLYDDIINLPPDNKITSLGSSVITLFRNPIDRCISMYYHSHRKRSSQPFIDWLNCGNKHGEHYYRDNTMTRFLCRSYYSKDRDKPLDDNDYIIALKRLNVINFGLTEDYDNTLKYFQSLFPNEFKNIVGHITQNVGGYHGGKRVEHLQSGVSEAIGKANYWDIKLYQEIIEIYKRRVM